MKKTIIGGYGGATVVPLGAVNESVEIDELSIPTKIYIVPDGTQEVDVLLGRPVTEFNGVYVYKTPQLLLFTSNDIFKELPGNCEAEEKVKVCTLNKIMV